MDVDPGRQRGRQDDPIAVSRVHVSRPGYPDKMPKGGNLTATAPTGVEPALTRRGDSELVALARFGEETVDLKAELAAGQSFAAGHGKGVEIALEAIIQVKAGELVDVKQTFMVMTHPVEPLLVDYGAARHMRYRGAEPFKLHPDTTASLLDPSLELADAKDILEQLD